MCFNILRLLCRTKRFLRDKSKILQPKRTPAKQLMRAIKRRKLDVIVQLYVDGVDGSIVDKDGDNLLHQAVKTDRVEIVRAVLLLFAYKYNLFSAKNNQGKMPIDCTESVPIQKSIRVMEKNYATGSIIARNTKTTDAKDTTGTKTAIAKNPEHILLALDGGGIRGLVLVRILMYIERKLGTRLWDLVDWAAGTSTGGVLTLALAKGKTLEECQQLYLQMKNEMFEGKPPYEEKTVERIFRKALSYDMMASIVRPKLLITSARVNITPPRLKLFRNYVPNPYDSSMELLDRGLSDDPTKLHIFQVARCTSAAPSYFPPYDDIYADGGIICNNPTLELLTEFQKHRELARVKVKPACVISIGTGWPPSKGVEVYRPRIARILQGMCELTRRWEYYRGLYDCLLEQITESNGRPVSHARVMCKLIGTPFFRLSPKLNKEVSLDESKDSVLLAMMWDTELYMSKAQEAVDLVKLLRRHIQAFS